MPNNTTTCFRTPFKAVETKQQPAARARQVPQTTVTTISKHKPTFFEKVKKFVKKVLRTK